MTHHICCRECDFEALVDDNDEAGDKAWTNAEATGHRVASDSIDGGAEMVTDGGLEVNDGNITRRCWICGNRIGGEPVELGIGDRVAHGGCTAQTDGGETA